MVILTRASLQRGLLVLFCLIMACKAWAAPRRIISLAPSVTEMIYALGAGEEVVGVSSFSNYPPQVKYLPKVGPFTSPQLERIVALKPDLVIGLAQSNPQWIFTRLKSFHIKVVVLKNNGIKGIFENVALLGRVLERKKQAQKLIFKLKAEIKKLHERVKNLPRPKVFLQLSLRPLFTCGRSSYLHELIELAGGNNIAGHIDIPYPILSLETVVHKSPDIIVLCLMQEDARSAVKFWQRFPSIPAVKTHQIYVVDPDIFARPSLRVVQALRILIKIFHGQL